MTCAALCLEEWLLQSWSVPMNSSEGNGSGSAPLGSTIPALSAGFVADVGPTVQSAEKLVVMAFFSFFVTCPTLTAKKTADTSTRQGVD